LWNEYSTDREAYNRKVYGFKQYQAAKTQTDGIKNFVEGAQAQSDLDADQVRAGFTAIFSGNLGSLVLNEATSNKENVWSQTLQSMAQGGSPEIDPVKFKVQIDAHNVQMRTNIEKSRQTSLQSLDVYFANNPNISSKKRDEMRADINNAADVALRTYADDKGVGLGAMAAVLSTYRDKSLKEQSELVDLAIKQQTAMQNNTLVMAYWSGGAQRENLKKTQPHFYAFMENQERLLTSSVFGVRDIIQGATDLSTVNNGFKNAADNPGAVPTPPEQDPKVTRAFHEGLMATARTTVDKADKGNVLTPSEVNIISSAIATSIDTGANGRLLMTDYKKLGEKIGKMPEAESAVIKDNASSAMQTTVAKIQGIKRNLEAKYGVTMQIGVNSAGQIAAVIPVNLQNRPLTQPAQPNLQTAISEFNKTTAALTNNIVYGRSMLTGEDVKAVGADFANVINSGQGYGGFFSLAAQPVAGAGRGVVNPPMAGGEQPAAAQPAASSGTLSVGDVVNGYKYLGGDPNSEASWSAQ
jgi:hypothetical protein